MSSEQEQPIRPIYTKTRKTKRTQHQRNNNNNNNNSSRFHGAFSGGFSAGYFNTVGSKGGWKPKSNDDDSTEEQDNDHSSTPWSIQGQIMKNKTSSTKQKKRRRATEQKVEDFMDDQDANEWGGPMGIRREYTSVTTEGDGQELEGIRKNSIIADNSDTKDIDTNSTSNKMWTKMPHDIWTTTTKSSLSDSVGRRLLRSLGWRDRTITITGDDKDGSCPTKITYAYVPLQNGDGDDDDEHIEKSGHKNDKNDCNNENMLKSKRLRRIELKLNSQQEELSLPAPKTDVYGIGYEPFQNAPEFKAHREMRRKRAEERARAATSSNGRDRMNVYRTSDLYDDEDEDNVIVQSKSDARRDEQQNMLTYETTADFIGTKSVGGFALHDDDDDVYDAMLGEKKGSIPTINKHSEIYHNEIYEASDSDDGGKNDIFSSTTTALKGGKEVTRSKGGGGDAFSGALNAWASGNSRDCETKEGTVTTNNVVRKATTSDGKLPLAGFTLGGGGDCLPKDLNATRWAGPDVPMDYVITRHKFHEGETVTKMKELSSVMKRDLQTEKRKNVGISLNKDKHNIHELNMAEPKRDMGPLSGKTFLSLSKALKERFTGSDSKIDTNIQKGDKPERSQVTRTIVAWQPSSLLCKRFHVPVPRVNKAALGKVLNDKKKSGQEENFFRNDVLGLVGSQTTSQTDNANKSLDVPSLSSGVNDEDIPRPSMEVMKSIFEPESDNDMDISSDDDSTTSSSALQIQEVPSEENKGIDDGVGDNIDKTKLDRRKIEVDQDEGLRSNSKKNERKRRERGSKRKNERSRKSKRRSKLSDDSSVSSYEKNSECSDSSDESKRRKKDSRRRRRKKSHKSSKRKRHRKK